MNVFKRCWWEIERERERDFCFQSSLWDVNRALFAIAWQAKTKNMNSGNDFICILYESNKRVKCSKANVTTQKGLAIVGLILATIVTYRIDIFKLFSATKKHFKISNFNVFVVYCVTNILKTVRKNLKIYF